VDASLAEGQKISPLFVNVKLFEIVRIHTKLGPKSKPRTLMFVLFGLGVFCAFSGFMLFPSARSACKNISISNHRNEAIVGI
jgi:hypothetical protein